MQKNSLGCFYHTRQCVWYESTLQPNNGKKYAPKPNLYAFFIALGLALLKNDGKMAYIIPQTILTETDYDVLRYHLANRTTIL